MRFQYAPYAIPLFLAAAMAVALALYALRRWQRPEALTFGLLMVALSLWSLFHALSISGADFATQYLLNRLKYVGVVSVPPLWLILALQCTGNRSVLSRRNVALMFLPALVLLPIALTDHLTHLWWPEVRLGDFAGWPALMSRHGMPYYVHVVYSYLCAVWGLGLYVLFYRRAERVYRLQALLLIVAGALPLAASVLTTAGLSPLPWGLDPFVLTVSGVFVAIAIFRYRFLGIIPVARRAVVEKITEGVIVTDTDGQIIDINPAARALLQLGRRPLAGVPVEEVASTSELRQALLEISRPGAEGSGERDVHLGSPGDGRVVSLTSTPLSHGLSGQLGWIILLRDISERVAAQRRIEALYRQADLERQRLAQTISTANDAIVLLDANGIVLAANRSAQQALQKAPGERLPPILERLLDRAQAAGETTQAEIDIGEQTFQAALAPLPDAGWVITMYDVTHYKQLSRLKDKFVSAVSHDLRTPLSSIMGYAEIAQRKATPEQTRQDALRRIQSSARCMSELIADLLSLATLEVDMDRAVEPVAVDRLARAAVKDLEGAALVKGLRICLEIDTHPLLKGDPRLISQVWHNLIDNAVKYTRKGTITVRVKAVDSCVLGQVADTGIGIPPADLPYVFDKFYRAGNVPPSEVGGTGLGLSLVKSIVEKHHGQVWAESQPGVGSTFTFTLPLQA